jgi:DNA-binding MarR family transcriptional regulator
MPSKKPVSANSLTDDLYDQPGHLIRRANQIANAMFTEVVSQDVTPIQYAILRMVHENPGIDQVSLSNLIALDTSTTALTAARLETKGLLKREVSEANRRQLRLSLTADGLKLITGLVSSVHRMRARLLEGLEPEEQQVFMQLMQKFVHLNNEQSRAPLRARNGQRAAAEKEAQAAPPRQKKRA